MRLSLVISSLTAGGAERVMSTLANAWSARGWEIDLMTTHDAGRPPHYGLSPAIRLQSVDPGISGPLKQPAIVRALGRSIRNAKPDVVISFLNYTNILTLAACRGLGRPVIVSERLDPRVVDIGPAWSLMRRFTYRRCALLIAQTPTAAALYEHLAPGRVRVIANPVLRPAARPSVAPKTAEIHRPTILAVGRLHPQKGFDLALQAMHLLDGVSPEWRLVILGEGPARRELESLRDKLGLADRVFLPGKVADPWIWLQKSEIFLMSSRSEGFPNALCEAMAAGMAAVSTDCPSGPSDIIIPEIDGILVPPGQPAAIAAALGRLMASEELRSRLAAAAPRVLERYALDMVLAAWDRALAEIAGTVAPKSGAKGRSA